MKLGFEVIESAQKALPYISESSPSGVKSDERCLTGHLQRHCNLTGECVQVLWVQVQVQIITFRNHLATKLKFIPAPGLGHVLASNWEFFRICSKLTEDVIPTPPWSSLLLGNRACWLEQNSLKLPRREALPALS